MRAAVLVVGAVLHILPFPSGAIAVPSTERCQDAKLKAVGKKTDSFLKAYGKDIRNPDPDRLLSALGRAQAKFSQDVTKADSLGVCSGEELQLETEVDEFVEHLLELVEFTCGDQTHPVCNGTCPEGMVCSATWWGGQNRNHPGCVCVQGQTPCRADTLDCADGACPPGDQCTLTDTDPDNMFCSCF